MTGYKTQRLYYENPKLYSLKTRVLACHPHKTDQGDFFKVLLKETIIFPEGGGQPSDAAFIAGNPVREALDEGECVAYIIEKSLEANKEVELSVDALTRLEHSRQHTGEHILSGILKREYGMANVGFHMGADYSTIDTDGELLKEDVLNLERLVNRAIMSDLPIRSEIVAPKRLETLTLRKDASKLAQGDAPVRIVYIDDGDIDSCACCGTHLERTGEVGFFSITAAKRYKGGMRLWFICGERAVNDALRRKTVLEAIAADFSGGAFDAHEAVRKQSHELADLRHELRDKTAKLFFLTAKALLREAETVRGVRVVIATEQGDAKTSKLLMESILKAARTENVPLVLALAFSIDEGRIYYSLGSDAGVKPDMGELIKSVNLLINGKGGGRGCFAQGSAAYKGDSFFTQALEQVSAYIKNALMK